MKPINLTSSFSQGRNAEQYIKQNDKKRKRKKSKEIFEKLDSTTTTKIPFMDLPQSIDIALPKQLNDKLNSLETILFQLRNKTYIREKLNYIETFIEIYQTETHAFKKKQIRQLFLQLYKRPSHFYIQKKLLKVLQISILADSKEFGEKCVYLMLRSNLKILTIYQKKQYHEELIPYIKRINACIELLVIQYNSSHEKKKNWLLFLSLILRIENKITLNILDKKSLGFIYHLISHVTQIQEKKRIKYYEMIDRLIKKYQTKKSIAQKIKAILFSQKDIIYLIEEKIKNLN